MARTPLTLLAPLRLLTSFWFSLSLCSSLLAMTPPQAPRPTTQAPKPGAKPQTPAPAPSRPGTAGASAPTSPAAPGSTASAIANTCEYCDPKDAAALLFPDASATTAPSKVSLLSCGYTSPSGDAVNVSIADYGVASVAQEFFAKTRESLKNATNEDTLGVPGFAFVDTDAPPRVDVTAVKDTQIVTIESSGPTAGTVQAVAALRAIMIKLLPKILPPAPPAP